MARRLSTFYATQMHRFTGAKRILDVGCGPGHLMSVIAKSHPQAKVEGVDKDATQIRIAKRNHGDEQLSFQVAASENLPHDDDSFDAVVTSESFHHWSEPAEGLTQMRRVTRPGGRVMIWETCGDITKKELASWTGWVPPLWIFVIRWIFTAHGYTTSRLHTELLPLVKAEFGDCEVERVNGWWLVTAVA